MLRRALRGLQFGLGVALACLATTPASASDPIGVYAIIDKVVLEPAGDGAPERVQLWGAFSVAKGHGRHHGENYQPPVRGYLYFQIPADVEKVEKCRNEWRDLVKLAGTGECVGFGSRYHKGPVRVRSEGETPEKPTAYALGWGGIRKLRADTRHRVVRRLRALPQPLTPRAGEKTPLGIDWQRNEPLILVAGNCAASTPETRYLFELEAANGEIIASPPIPAGSTRTKWTVPGLLRENMRYTWRVRIVGKEFEGGVPVAVSHFETGSTQ